MHFPHHNPHFLTEPAAPLPNSGTNTSLASVWPDEMEEANLKTLDLMDSSLFVGGAQQQQPEEMFCTPPALSPASSQASLPAAEDETQNLIDEVEEFLVHHESKDNR